MAVKSANEAIRCRENLSPVEEFSLGGLYAICVPRLITNPERLPTQAPEALNKMLEFFSPEGMTAISILFGAALVLDGAYRMGTETLPAVKGILRFFKDDFLRPNKEPAGNPEQLGVHVNEPEHLT